MEVSMIYTLVLIFEGKEKFKVALCLTKHHAMKMYWRVEV
jgi:hypothetical protein